MSFVDKLSPYFSVLCKIEQFGDVVVSWRIFEHVALWYDTANWLPVGVAMLDEQGNTRRLRLSDAKVNPELDEDQRRRLAGTVPTTADWVVDERRCPDGVEPREGGE